MSVWDAIVGQGQVVEQLKAVAAGDPASIAQSWLICGPPGSGRSNVARAFAAALESPDHGLDDVPTRTTEQILAGTHPDVTVLATNKVTIGIDEVRQTLTNWFTMFHGAEDNAPAADATGTADDAFADDFDDARADGDAYETSSSGIVVGTKFNPYGQGPQH